MTGANVPVSNREKRREGRRREIDFMCLRGRSGLMLVRWRLMERERSTGEMTLVLLEKESAVR